MNLSKKARLLAFNPSLSPKYVLWEDANPSALSDQLKELAAEAAMSLSPQQQRVVDKMMPIVGIYENGHFIAVARCDTEGCETESRWSCDGVPRDHRVVFTKFRDRKWHANKRRLTCPRCVARKKAKPVTEFKREPPMKPIGEALRTAVVKTTSPGFVTVPPDVDQISVEFAEGEDQVSTIDMTTDKAKAGKRQVYAHLLDNYDDEHKRYKGEWSDARIAQVTKMSEAFVAQIRETDFGPAGPPPQLIDLKTRLTRLEERFRTEEGQMLRSIDRLGEMQKELEALRSLANQVQAAHGWEA